MWGGVSARIAVVLALIVVAGCTALAQWQWEQRHGKAAPVQRELLTPLAQYREPEYFRDIKPIFDKRCVVCHGCYDAPCQLKLSSFSGVNRGASQVQVYDGSRLVAEHLSRLFIDANSADEWRQKDFYPVLNEYQQDETMNLVGSSLYQMLELKRQHPSPNSGPLPDSFDFALDRKQQCTRVENFEQFARDYPLWGMPYGMPAIEENHVQTIKRWLETGAKVAAQKPPTDAVTDEINRWETFLNGDPLKHQLMSRYIYEHLFLGDLYFAGVDNQRFFRIERSRTPPGEPVDLIATRRPYDDPGVGRVYYRLQPVYATLLVKSHMPYALDASRMEKWRSWFLESGGEIDTLPSYDVTIASNPIKAFDKIPLRSRYRFLLDEAQFTIMGFIKGPVCRGQIALNVINDQFWVVFLSPDSSLETHGEAFLEQQSDNLSLPSQSESNAMPTRWLSYSRAHSRYLQAKLAYIERTRPQGQGALLDDIWDGDGNNPNAALTVFRHFDSATVVQGFVGNPPKTAWVVSYSLLERIHYLLVAGYDVYGNVGHQLLTRLYMDFFRMEGEFNFLAFLPENARLNERKYWYRNVSDDVAQYVYGSGYQLDRETSIPFKTEQPKLEFFELLRTHLGGALNPRWSFPAAGGLSGTADAALQTLRQLRGSQLALLPQVSVISVESRGHKKLFTLIHNTGRANVSTLFFESSRLLPEEDNISLVPGILGAYPNAFFDLKEEQLPAFVAAIERLGSESDYRQLVDRYGVRRNAEGFWPYSDWLHQQLQAQSPVEAGVLDYNRFENR